MTRNRIYLLVAAALAIVALICVWRVGGSNILARSDTYQAVFLDNHQVFFGHITSQNKGYITLRDVYYLRDSAPLLDPAQAGSDLSLTKLGRELHAPEDSITISRQQILYIQSLTAGSRILSAINQAAGSR